MTPMIHRKYQILRRIIEEFVNSARPVSSGQFLEMSEFDVSSATIRNEMAQLEKEGLLIQPHTSAGRIPTAKGYQYFVESLMEIEDTEKESIFNEFKEAQKKYFLQKTKEKVFDSVSILSQLTENIAFATIPENKRTLFLGVASLLRQPEFSDNASASSVIEVLEGGFFETIENLEIHDSVEIHIGETHIFPHVQSCSLMCTTYNHNGFSGVLGIVGPMRMNYAKNKVLIEYTKMFIEGQKLLQ